MYDGSLLVHRALRYVDGFLDPGELIVEVEEATHQDRPGALFVTDQRVLLLATPVLGHGHYFVSIPLREVSDVMVGRTARMQGGCVLTVHLRRQQPGEKGVRFTTRRGKESRARQLADGIMREAARNLDRSGSSDRTDEAKVAMPVLVTFATEVAAFVGEHGGELYVWSEPVSDHRVAYRTAFKRPESVTFALYDDVSEFVLYLSEDTRWLSWINLELARFPGKRVKARLRADRMPGPLASARG